MNDQGIPTLKKRGFNLPGTRKVLTSQERADKVNKLTIQQKNDVPSNLSEPSKYEELERPNLDVKEKKGFDIMEEVSPLM